MNPLRTNPFKSPGDKLQKTLRTQADALMHFSSSNQNVALSLGILTLSGHKSSFSPQVSNTGSLLSMSATRSIQSRAHLPQFQKYLNLISLNYLHKETDLKILNQAHSMCVWVGDPSSPMPRGLLSPWGVIWEADLRVCLGSNQWGRWASLWESHQNSHWIRTEGQVACTWN